ncbi:MAG: hypothetical protein WDN44_04365 [Sphingomonas sp.]
MAEIRGFRQLARIVLSIVQARQTGETNIMPRSGIKTMTYQPASFRNAFMAVAFALVLTAVLMAGTVGPVLA